MISFDLKCRLGHVFEAWFGSSRDYEDQKQRGLLSCPICDDGAIEKAVMAPAVGAKGNRRAAAPVPANMAADEPEKAKAMLCTLAEMQKKLVAESEYVGTRFADEARAMHHGERKARGIYGEVSKGEAADLLEEGIPAVPLPFPVRPNGGDA